MNFGLNQIVLKKSFIGIIFKNSYYINYNMNILLDNFYIVNLIGIRETAHTRHDAEDIVISRVDANFCGVSSLDSRVGKN